MKLRRGIGVGMLGTLVMLSCGADRSSAPVGATADASVPVASVEILPESSAAASRIAELRGRFRLPVGAPLTTRFEAAGGHVRAVLSPEMLHGVTRPARVALPLRASDEVELEDATSRVAVKFALEHVRAARIEVTGGVAVYRGALDGADVVHRVHAEGTEDYVVFEKRPAREELTYRVDVSRVPGLRLVSNTLEFLDDTGTPGLRVARPYLVDAKGQRHEAKLTVSGCAYDTSPAGPWGRRVTAPGANRCTVHVTWNGDIGYPAMVDPPWSATGSLAGARFHHTSSVLPSGKVLIAGGINGVSLTSAELFDPIGNVFAATGSMATGRAYHTASVLASGKVLIAGGVTNTGLAHASAELFDPAGNAGGGAFVATASMTVARNEHTATVLPSGKVLVAGGTSAGSAHASAELFDPAGNAGAGTFIPTASMAAGRRSHTASVLLSGKVLVAGGINAGFLASAELFDPAGNTGAGTFAATGSLAAARSGHTASVLPSGKVLVAGGHVSAELFDPAGSGGAGTFAVTAPLDARTAHTASLLPTGKVLIAGGVSPPAERLASAALFDPAGNANAGTFVAVPAMASARSGHTASVLPSGTVLVAAGFRDAFLASAELFSLVAPGSACSLAGGCLSGFCADGVCCDMACNGGCDRCDVPSKVGTCTVSPAGDLGANPACGAPFVCDGVSAVCPTSCASDAACAATHYCAASGACELRKAKAAACNAPSSCKQPNCRECNTGFCVDGVCCDKACSGQCDACDSFAGACGPIEGTPHGSRPACPSGEACSASTNRCEVPLAAATCDGDHTTTASNGTKRDCTPYKCDSNGACQVACSSVSECVAPSICDSAKQCVPPPVDTASESGCSVAIGNIGHAGWQVAWLTAAVALGVRRRRRRCQLTDRR